MPYQRGGLPPEAPNAMQLPYALRRSSLATGLMTVPLVIAGAAAFVAFDVFLAGRPGGFATSPALAGELAVALIFLGAAGASLLRPVATLFPDRIETQGLFGRRVLRRENIQGFRTVSAGRGGMRLELVSSSAYEPSVLLPLWTRNDSTMVAWLDGAPDVAAQAREAHRAAVMADPRFGATPQERAARLGLARGLAIGLVVVGGVVGVWLLLRPFDLVSLVAGFMVLLAGLALGLIMEGLFAWLPSGDGRASLAGAAIPLGALSVRMALTADLVQPGAMIAFGAVCALAAGGVAFARLNDSARRGRAAIGAAVVGGLLGYGALTALDIGMDRSAGTVSEATIVRHRMSHGRRSETWYLTLSPSPDGGKGEVSVPRRLWAETSNGDLACVTRHPGALGIAWFTVASCTGGRT